MDRLVSLVLRLLEVAFNFFRRWVLPLLWHLVVLTFDASLYALAAVWVGWGPATERIVASGMQRAALARLPSTLDPYIRIFLTIYAFGIISYGWIFVAFLTVAIVNALLRHYTGRWINF